MLFDSQHVLYLILSGILTVLLLWATAKFVKTEEKRIFILKLSAVVTVALHYSNIWVEYFSNGGSTDGLEGSHLFPIYPCHILMWLLVVVAFWKNKSGKAFTVLAEFCFWGGIVCGSIGILLNENYANTPDLRDWYILKGMLSHSTMIFGCLYTCVGKFMKIRVFNVVSVALGLIAFIIDGMFINALYAVCGLDEVNAMYLLHSPYESMPWLSPILMGAVAVLVLFAGLALYELRLPKEERWYTRLKKYTERFSVKEKN